MNRKAFFRFISNRVNVKVYPDFIPEKATLPAIAYEHSSDKRQRVLTGVTSGKSDIWRLTLIGNSRSECDTLSGQINVMEESALDDADFQAIMILSETDDPLNHLDKQYRVSIDVKTYDR